VAETILVVDDERPIADILQYNLERAGYRVLVATSGPEALELARAQRPALVILDLMLPGIDGLTVCQTLRRETQVAILILTAKDDEVDKVVGLEVGADDYVTKPFSPREILARVKAILRRAGARPPAPEGEELRVGDIVLNLNTYEAHRGGKPIELTHREFELLKFLASRPGQVFSREAILQAVWGYEYFGEVRTVDVTVRRLREKIEEDPSEPRIVLTRRGVGYYVRRGEE
jgi:two-component system response regulator VicR